MRFETVFLPLPAAVLSLQEILTALVNQPYRILWNRSIFEEIGNQNLASFSDYVYLKDTTKHVGEGRSVTEANK